MELQKGIVTSVNKLLAKTFNKFSHLKTTVYKQAINAFEYLVIPQYL